MKTILRTTMCMAALVVSLQFASCKNEREPESNDSLEAKTMGTESMENPPEANDNYSQTTTTASDTAHTDNNTVEEQVP